MMELLLNFPLCGELSKSMLLLCNTYTREMLLSLPAAAACLLLLCHCSAAQVQLVWLCNHWVRLYCCTLPGACCSSHSSSLAWVEEFKFSLSLELAWLGVPWLGYLGGNIWNIPLIFLLYFKESHFYQNYHQSIWRVLGKCDNSLRVQFLSVPRNSIKQLNKHKVQ